jgi:hypothetical protein
VVIIPTRNRASLACRALESVLRERRHDVRVLVSDNSSRDDERQLLEAYCRKLRGDLVHYVRAPEPMDMTDHYEWAMGQAEALASVSAASHLVYLTDRMLFRPGGLSALLVHCIRYPGDLISYNYDTVDDSGTRVRLLQQVWSGKLVAGLLALSSRIVYTNALPRNWNAMTPRTLVHRIRERFGSVFASVSPDVCFAYRSLAVLDRILYYDAPLMVESALDRGNGASYQRAMLTPDHRAFLADLARKGRRMHEAAPVPEFETITNAMVNEFCFVRGEAGGSKFVAVDRFSYLGAIAWDVQAMQDLVKAKRMRRLLSDCGWTPVHAAFWLIRKAVAVGLHRPGSIWRMLQDRMRARPVFRSTEDAIAHAFAFPRRRSDSLAHLRHLGARPVGAGAGSKEGASQEGTGGRDRFNRHAA